MSIQDLTPWRQGKKSGDMEAGLHPIQTLHQSIDHLFSDFIDGYTPGLFGRSSLKALEGGHVTPRVDVIENDKDYSFMAELPGVDEDDIEITIVDNVLSVTGEKKSEIRDERKDDNYLRIERSYGAFERSFSLPADADENKVAATFEKGILTITVPKNAKAKTKTKKVKLKKVA